MVAAEEFRRFSGDEKIGFMQETQIPYYRDNGYPKTQAYVLFWLGYEYREKGEYEKAIRCYEETMKLLTPSDVYYANAKAAIKGEKRSIAASKNPEILSFDPDVTGEVYKKTTESSFSGNSPGTAVRRKR